MAANIFAVKEDLRRIMHPVFHKSVEKGCKFHCIYKKGMIEKIQNLHNTLGLSSFSEWNALHGFPRVKLKTPTQGAVHAAD